MARVGAEPAANPECRQTLSAETATPVISFALEARFAMNASRWIRLAVGAAVVTVAVAGCSRSAQSYFERGNAYLEKGNVDAAVLEYRKAVEKDPKFAPARLKLGELYLKRGNGAGALGEYVRAADLLPNDADAQLKAGSLLLMAGRVAGQPWRERTRRWQSILRTRMHWCFAETPWPDSRTSTRRSRRFVRPSRSIPPRVARPTSAVLQFVEGTARGG